MHDAPSSGTAAAPAIVLANDYLTTTYAKVAHGLIRGSERFAVQAVVDPACSGRDAGEVLDGTPRDIPVVSSIDEAVTKARISPRYCIIGIATHGGRVTAQIRALAIQALHAKLSVVNGLHDVIAEDPEIAALAAANDLELIDLRRPRPTRDLHFWHGDVLNVRAPRVAVLGADCAVGKRTTARMLVQYLKANEINAEMIFTGQTGWMQGARFGFILDSTPNDYVSGELEHAIVSCDRATTPDVIVIEGQSALRNPSGPCGAELLLSGAARGVVLQYAPGREKFDGYESLDLPIPSLASEIELISHYGATTLAVTLNDEGVDKKALAAFAEESSATLGIPVIDPMRDGLSALLAPMRDHLDRQSQ